MGDDVTVDYRQLITAQFQFAVRHGLCALSRLTALKFKVPPLLFTYWVSPGPF